MTIEKLSTISPRTYVDAALHYMYELKNVQEAMFFFHMAIDAGGHHYAFDHLANYYKKIGDQENLENILQKHSLFLNALGL
jgi:hypothetical protein